MTWPIVSIALRHEADVVLVRQRARRIAELLGFESQDRTRIATAASEIARNAFIHAGGGKAEFLLEGTATPQVFILRISDQGPGMADLDAVLEGRHCSKTGMGRGLAGARRLMDVFDVQTAPGRGTTVTLGKALPIRRKNPADAVAGIAARLARDAVNDPLAELREANGALLASLEELRMRQDELSRLNAELEDTNRGVVALYAELDERAQQLRQASEAKSRFLSHMSHEFRTPLSSILALSRLLLDEVDGSLRPEQAKQIGYIRKSAESLSELVNDLLDIAKVEAGKAEVRVSRVEVADLFAALRGVLKPLQPDAPVQLVFEEPHGVPALQTDEAKVSQILRNLVSNALKFTEQGEVRVSAEVADEGRQVAFRVSDTGVGIDPRDHACIFEEFEQIENRLQGRSKGTGLGLPLSRRLAGLLGGALTVESAPDEGSVFTLTLPVTRTARASGRCVLVVDDDEAFRYVLRQMISPAGFEVLEAGDGVEGLRSAREYRPDFIFLDLRMPRLDGYAVLRELARDPDAAATRIIVCTSSVIADDDQLLLKRAEAVLPKSKLSRELVASLLNGGTA